MKAILVNDDRSLKWDDVENPVIKDDEVRYHKINADFLANILEEIKSTIEDTNA